GFLIQHLDEAGGIALGRDVEQAIGSGGCHEDERRMSDEAASMFVNHSHDLGNSALCGWSQHCSQLLFARDDIAETMPKVHYIVLHGTAHCLVRLDSVCHKELRSHSPVDALFPGLSRRGDATASPLDSPQAAGKRPIRSTLPGKTKSRSSKPTERRRGIERTAASRIANSYYRR